MRKVITFFVLLMCLVSCVSGKKYKEAQDKLKSTEDLLNSTAMKLNDCLMEREGLLAKYEELSKNNQAMLSNFDNVAQLNEKSATNLEKTLESLREKEITIKKLQNAIAERDSKNASLVQNIKKALINTSDEQVNVSLEKGMVYVSIADKLLFSSGSYVIANEAQGVLEKVAKVMNNRPDFDFMVEGHTDNIAIKTTLVKDNWDLSVLRATAVVRALQENFGVNPKQITAAGRGEYAPVNANETAQQRALNRRTRIIIMPKLAQFYSTMEQEIKNEK